MSATPNSVTVSDEAAPASAEAAPARRLPPWLVARLLDACERGWMPDALARAGIRTLIRQRLRAELRVGDEPLRLQRQARLIEELRNSPIAVDTEAANAQHYEVPAEFFHLHLGPRLKYSSAWYATGRETLAEAEEAMLALYAERAGLADGQRILDLGCGWGSLSLWLAEKFPHAQIVGFSNSQGQRRYIEARAAERGLRNLCIVTGNIADFDFLAHPVGAGFDRVVSVEMFEHMKNYSQLLSRVASWMKPGGQLLVHIFAHRTHAYHFTARDASDWMTRHFFTGGLMPSEHLLHHFQDHLKVCRQWWVDGRHYERTANEWLARMDAARGSILGLFRHSYGERQAGRWFQRWRMFYMAVAELFGYDRGQQWGVAHCLLQKP